MNFRPFVLFVGLLPMAACADHNGGLTGLNLGSVPLFETRTMISTGTIGHSDFAVADFNRDGFLDMAVIGFDGNLQIMLGGNGATFSKGATISLNGGVPIWIASGDLNGDGAVDLAVVRTDANETTILLNDGHANFTIGQVLPVGHGSLAVVIGDANGDGILDVIVAQLTSPQLALYINDGQAQFTQRPGLQLPSGGVPFNMALGDVNGDGRKDLVVCDSQGDRILIYFGTGGSQNDFDPDPLQFGCGHGPRAVSIGDLNRDGQPDLVVSATDDDKVQMFTDYLSGKGTSHFDINVNGPPSVSAIGDVTGDGLLDLVVCLASRASILVVPGSTGPQSVPNTGLGDPFQLDASGLTLRPFIGDLNNDGKNDLLVLSGLFDHVNMWLARNDGQLAGARNYDSGLPSAESVAGADFDGDGKADVIVGGPSAGQVSVMVASATGELSIAATFPVGAAVYRVTAADLDGDGRMDVVLSCAGGLKLLHNRSTPGTFLFDVVPDNGNGVFPVGSGPFGIAVADMDGDGNLDLLVCDFRGGDLHLLHGTATPFVFGADTTVALGGGPIDVVAADFTGDGIVDAAISRAGASDIVVLRNDGHGSLSIFANIPVAVAPNYLITGDFDRDGRADLVVSNGAAASVQVLYSRPVGFDMAAFPAGATPTALLARDLTGDGIPDILVASLVGGDFRVLVGDGRGGFPNVFGFPGTLGATSAVLQDVTGDGQPDLLIGSIITNRVSVVRNITTGPLFP